METSESACHRTYFYVGGTYMDDENNPGERIMQGQLYVEQLTPLGDSRQPFPLVFIHGGGQTGSNWLNTPDGRKGWASYFLDQGYVIYIIDCPTRGRSAWQPSSSPLVNIPVSFAETHWTAPGAYNLWPQAHLHTQWPGNGHPGCPTFDAYFASTVQWLPDAPLEQRGLQTGGAALLDLINRPAIIFTHSQGGPSGWLIADARPNLVKAIVAIEPAGPPFVSKALTGTTRKPYGIADIPLTYDPLPPCPPLEGDVEDEGPLRTHTITPPPSSEADGRPWILQAEPARKLINLLHIPVIFVTAEASYHAAYDECTVRFLRQAGVEVDWVRLAEHGIKGNGHMMFLEMNNLEVAALVESRIAKVVG